MLLFCFAEGETDENTPPTDGSTPMETEASADAGKAKKQKLTLSYEEYKQIANLLVLYMRRREGDGEGEGHWGRDGIQTDSQPAGAIYEEARRGGI